MSIIDIDALERRIREIARAEAARPEYVTQRTSQDVVGVPHADFLEAARAGEFPSFKQRRLVFARTRDVIEWVESHPVSPRAQSNDDTENAALQRVGARRVS